MLKLEQWNPGVSRRKNGCMASADFLPGLHPTGVLVPIGNAMVFAGGAIPRSEPPWYAINKKDPGDKWFTHKAVASQCYAVFKEVARKHGYNLNRHIFVEPSAGEGCFTELLPSNRRIALDIDPQGKGIKQADFLKWSPRKKGAYAVIGNPPFGIRGALALEFLNRAGRFAELVGFILPMTFASDGKGGAMTRVKNLNLLHSMELEPNSFYVGEQDRDICTVFQVWGAREVPAALRPDTCDSFIHIRTVCTAPDRRCGLDHMHEYDCFITSSFYDNHPPQIVFKFDDVKYGSGYGIVIKKQKRKVLAALRKTNWMALSSRSTNHCRHLRMRHIRDAVIGAGFKDKK